MPDERVRALEEHAVSTMRVLVVFYSLSGHTRDLGREIADALGADVETLSTPGERAGRRPSHLRCHLESLLRLATPIVRPVHDPALYDLVVIGSPVWLGRVAGPVRSWLRFARGRIHRSAYFVTHGAGGRGESLEQMHRLSGVEPVAELAIGADDLASGEHRERLVRFLAVLRDVVHDPRVPDALDTHASADT